ASVAEVRQVEQALSCKGYTCLGEADRSATPPGHAHSALSRARSAVTHPPELPAPAPNATVSVPGHQCNRWRRVFPRVLGMPGEHYQRGGGERWWGGMQQKAAFVSLGGGSGSTEGRH